MTQINNITNQKPNVPIGKFKRTKIIATIGPSTDSYESIHDLIKNGTNGLRLNFSHGTEDERERQIKWIRKASREYGKPVAIIQDLQGPKMRCGDFGGIINVAKGQTIRLGYKADYEKTGVIPTQYELSDKVKRGQVLFLFDGKITTKVTSVQDGIIHVRSQTEGILIKRKSINVPDTDFGGDIITKKDRKDIMFGSTHDIDYVAMSFVQSAEDIHEMRKILKNAGSSARIIAKIETKASVENLEDIVIASDAVMVARGDLATETSPEAVPVMQRAIIGLGIKHRTPTIVATQMLASMTDRPEPTRAEVSDIATAVILGSDSVMLSDETANGLFPIESVEVMKRVILYTQKNMPLQVTYAKSDPTTTQAAISSALIQIADEIGAKAIVAETKSGATARQVASHRPARPIIAVTSDARVAQQLAIVYGTKSYVRPDEKYAAAKLTDWLSSNMVLKKGDVVVTAAGQCPGVVGTTDTIKIRVIQ